MIYAMYLEKSIYLGRRNNNSNNYEKGKNSFGVPTECDI